jgi:aminoglycoside/choline kinase family phosphotransferase
MSSAKQVNAKSFEPSASKRLARYLEGSKGVKNREIIALTPDASTRKYFRIPWEKGTAVAAVYPEQFDPEVHPYLDVTRLLLAAGIPVPEIYAVDGTTGIIIQEDLGDQQLCSVYELLSEEECEEYKERAIDLIAQIQNATEKAYEMRSIASRLAFDEAKLTWELDFFFEHYFASLRHETLKHSEEAELRAEFRDVAAELAACPRVLCHRDYHAANLIVDKQDNLRIIDYQDARMGPASYDLVSLLLDRVTAMPSHAEVRMRRLHFLAQRERCGLPAIDPDEFAREFRLMTVQRCLKAAGTFSCQTGVYGRGETYAQYIEPMLLIVLQAAQWLERFPALQAAINARVPGK